MQTGVTGWWLQQGGYSDISSVLCFHVIVSTGSVHQTYSITSNQSTPAGRSP